MLEAAVANRRAALLAHALPGRDRDWLLRELATPQRQALAALLDELRSMRVPRDPALVRQLLEMDAHAADGRQALDRLAPRDLPDLLAVLRPEPPDIVARLLRVQPWPWRELVLQELGPAVRHALDAAGGLSAAPHLDAAIAAAVWDAVQHRRAPLPVHPGWATRLLASLRKGTRP